MPKLYDLMVRMNDEDIRKEYMVQMEIILNDDPSVSERVKGIAEGMSIKLGEMMDTPRHQRIAKLAKEEEDRKQAQRQQQQNQADAAKRQVPRRHLCSSGESLCRATSEPLPLGLHKCTNPDYGFRPVTASNLGVDERISGYCYVNQLRATSATPLVPWPPTPTAPAAPTASASPAAPASPTDRRRGACRLSLGRGARGRLVDERRLRRHQPPSCDDGKRRLAAGRAVAVALQHARRACLAVQSVAAREADRSRRVVAEVALALLGPSRLLHLPRRFD